MIGHKILFDAVLAGRGRHIRPSHEARKRLDEEARMEARRHFEPVAPAMKQLVETAKTSGKPATPTG